MSRFWEWLEDRYQIALTLGIATLLEAGLLTCCFRISEGVEERIITFALLVLAYAIGSIIGTIMSPYDTREAKKFAAYGRAVAVFASGYLASKLDGAITFALSREALSQVQPLLSFRVIAFTATLLLAAKVTFIFRAYEDA